MAKEETVTEDGEILDGEVLAPVGTEVLTAIHRTEIDQQIATAKAYPRNIAKVKAELSSLATMDEETAEECIYALPRGGKPIRGASARFADILLSIWGNARTDCYISDVNRDKKYVEAIGVFMDVERNTIRRRMTRRRIVDKCGRIYNEDMILMTGNAACSIAERNAILAGVPKVFWNDAYLKAYALTAGTVQTLADKRGKALKNFGRYGVVPEQVFAVMGVKSEEDITVEDIPTLRGMLSALKSGEETVESIFGRAGGANGFEGVKNPLGDDDGGKPSDDKAKDKPRGQTAEQAAVKEGPGKSASGKQQPQAKDTKEQKTEGGETGTPATGAPSTGQAAADGNAAGHQPATISPPPATSEQKSEQANTGEQNADGSSISEEGDQQDLGLGDHNPAEHTIAEPTTEDEYEHWAMNWINAAQSVSEIEQKWSGDRELRRKCDPDDERRARIVKAKDAKIAELKAKG